MSDDGDSVKDAAGRAVAEMLKAARDNPKFKEAASNVGQTALTVTQLINNALLPVAAVNFAFKKARDYFNNKFEQDLAAKTSTIPPEHVVEPKASIVGPTLQGLAFAHEETNLKEMYLSLLATSMDGRIASVAHPAFAEIIKQLSPEEAALLATVLSVREIAIAEWRAIMFSNKQPTLIRHIVQALCPEGGQPVKNPRLPAMIDNWDRLGLVLVDYDTWISDDDAGKPFLNFSTDSPQSRRDWWNLYQREVIALRDTRIVTTEFQRGVLSRTAFGEQFARAVGLLEADDGSSGESAATKS